MFLKYLWTIIFFGGMLWYIITIFIVGIKGYSDIKLMLFNINKKFKDKN